MIKIFEIEDGLQIHVDNTGLEITVENGNDLGILWTESYPRSLVQAAIDISSNIRVTSFTIECHGEVIHGSFVKTFRGLALGFSQNSKNYSIQIKPDELEKLIRLINEFYNQDS